MPCKRNYSRFSNFLNVVDSYRNYVAVGFLSLCLGAIIGSSYNKPVNSKKEPEKTYPTLSQVYKIDCINNGFPVMRTKMSDGSEEILNSSDAHGVIYTNIRDLKKKDVESKAEEWDETRRNINSKIREIELPKSK